MRPIAIGRRNWLHLGSKEAGPKIAAIFSIVESCRKLGVPIRQYLADVLPGLADRSIQELAGLTPQPGFAAGEELSAHSAPTPAVLYFLEGEAELQLGTDKVQAEAGSFVYMPPMLSHGISAKTGLRMLLVQMKEPS